MPSAEAWAAMSEAEKVALEEHILAVLDEYREMMAEGTPHSRAKIGTFKDLMDHYGRAGRRVFLATELAVLYPGESTIVPDLLAVMDVADPDRERNSWRVADEGRGVDLVFEFRNLGKKHKDLVENVKDYARLGISEYFSFDCRTKRLRGWRLQNRAARVYTPLMPQGGLFQSLVLDLEVGEVDGRLRFFKNQAQIPSSDELVARLQKLTDSYQERLEEAERTAQEAERARQEAVGQIESTRAGAVEIILRQLAARGIAVTEEQHARMAACDDLGQLLGWVARASSAASTEELLSG